MTHKLSLIIVLIATLLLPMAAPVAAQDAQNQTNQTTGPTTADDPDANERLYIDSNAYVTDWDYDDGVFTIDLEANETTTVYMMPPVNPNQHGEANGEARSVTVTADSTRTITLDGDGDLYVFTENFFNSAENPYLVLEGPEPLIGPPWSANDARIAGVATFLAFGLLMSWKMLQRLTGVSREPERVA